MPQLPAVGATGWGATLNTFLETAHDNTSGANGGKVKPAGIIGGTNGQLLVTNASGVPTWGSAAANQPKYDLYGPNIKVQYYTAPEADGTTNTDKLMFTNAGFNNPAGFPYLFGYGFGVGVSVDMSGKQGEIRTSLFVKKKDDTWVGGTGSVATSSVNGTVFRMGAGFSIWTPNATSTTYSYQEIVPNVPLPLDTTNTDLRVEVVASNTKSLVSNCQVQVIWWNGQ